jgi:hypothetical protein
MQYPSIYLYFHPFVSVHRPSQNFFHCLDENEKSVTFIPFEEEESASTLRCNIEHAYQVSFVEKQNNTQR